MLLALIAVVAIIADFLLPYRHLPWRPLEIDQPVGFATGFKLTLLNYSPRSWCDNLVQRSEQLQTTSVDTHEGKNGCGWSSAYQIATSGEVKLRGKQLSAMRCVLTAGSHIWLTNVDQLAEKYLGSNIARVHHAGTYSCRRMYNRSSGPMSEHAFANAWDVTGFELRDGRVISIKKHWVPRGSERQFLRAARDSACAIFSVVLSPDYNDAHNDHLHLDMGQGLSCQ
ncbi:MAG: extensin family protein [Pseudomonadales bacterium]